MTMTVEPPVALRGRLADADLVVLSHLRWDWVWQRPQHLISRLGAGRRTWFVEEPRSGEVPEPELRVMDAGPVTRVWLDMPETGFVPEFRDAASAAYIPFLTELLGDVPRDVWLYAPTALPLAEALQPRLLAYDVMDDLASFADAPPEMRLRMRRALDIADIAFAGGRSLHRSAASVRGAQPTHLFPSGVECDHYATSRELRRPHPRPVAGYVGVLDERLDLELVRQLAAALADWEIQMVGPVTKIDPATLPQADNISYPGMKAYDELPAVMAGFDVALMPFALNDATRSISPTKTLEYLAAGLPVVSTRVPDVVADWGDVVHLADSGSEFADACRHVAEHSVAERDARVAPLRAKHEWDNIAAGMRALLEQALEQDRTRTAGASA
jgi:glycosyltransferase involved in cell wall biosynthesis